MTSEIVSHGCRLNRFESEVIRGHLAGRPDILVINTCAVTAQAERDARQAIARAHRAQPGRPIVVTGCAAQLAPARWAALPGVTRVLGNEEKLRAEAWAPDAGSACADIMRAVPAVAHPITGMAGRARAFVAVQQGCDHRCTFCIIPFARGPNRSVPAGAVVEQIRLLAESGCQEVVLTGVDITSYGADLPGRPTLGSLARRVLRLVPGLARLRLSSLDPAALDEDFWALLADEPRLMPHLHLSLQAASDVILKRMKRRHSVAGAADVIARARRLRPGIAIGADVIAGFPTETDALFEETLAFVRDHALPYVHVFPYSERPGTPAARMPAVAPPVRRARAAALREAGRIAAARFHAGLIGSEARIVVERAGAGAGGHTEHFAPVRLAGDWAHGSLVRARITGANDAGLLAEAA
jgi:threonylcarbamoyladenosine tRNA methylthiotransferase MtaB